MMTRQDAIAAALAYVPDYLALQREYMPFLGVQIAVRVDGHLLLDHAEGVDHLEAGTPLATDHLFRIASHSKTFTAVACMQLVERGSLRLDDQARDHVPELAEAAMGTVTVRELLAHGSGMTRDGDDATFWSLDRRFPNRDELVDTIRRNGKVLEPNDRFKYSNIGYSLLGLIIEAASGTPYREYVKTNIVDRLGLANTGPDIDVSRVDKLAKGYSSRIHGPDRIEIEHIDTYAESSATGFYSTASDLTAYFQAHVDGDVRLLSDASKRKMRQVQWTLPDGRQYGLGLSVTTVNERPYYGHGGGYPGHMTHSKLDLERKLSISVLTNTNDGPAEKIAIAVLRLVDLALDEKQEATSEPQQAIELERFEGRFATLWGLTDIVNLGGRLYALNPALDDPAREAIEMEVVSRTELKSIGDTGYGDYGELMRYTFHDDDTVQWIRGAGGMRLVPFERFTLPAKVTRPA